MKPLSVGMVSPWPPVLSGIADYSNELFGNLSRRTSVTRYAPEEAAGALNAGHDVLLFQIGNDPVHAPSLEALRTRPKSLPAVLVLHDFVLHHLFAAAYLDRGREGDYARELERAHGLAGREFGARMLAGERVPIWDLDPWRFPMSAGVVSDATSVIVHSTLVHGAVLRARPGTRVRQIPHHVLPAVRTDRTAARQALGLPQERSIGVCLGIVTPAKRVERLLEGLRAVPKKVRPFLFVGGALRKESPLEAQVREQQLSDDVKFGGYLSEEDFFRAASAADFAVNLRFPTMGETSGAVARLAGFGLPLIVSDIGWFRELPDSFSAKAPVGSGEIEAIAQALTQLSVDEPERERRSRAALAWAAERHPEKTADEYLEVLEEAASGRARLLAAVDRVAGAAFSLGVGRPARTAERIPDGKVVARISTALSGLIPRGERME